MPPLCTWSLSTFKVTTHNPLKSVFVLLGITLLACIVEGTTLGQDKPQITPSSKDIIEGENKMRNILIKRKETADKKASEIQAKISTVNSSIHQQQAMLQQVAQQVTQKEQQLKILLSKPDDTKTQEEWANRVKQAKQLCIEQNTKLNELRRQIEQEQKLIEKAREAVPKEQEPAPKPKDPDASAKKDLQDRIEKTVASQKADATEIEKLQAAIMEANRQLTSGQASALVPYIVGANGKKVRVVYIECHVSGITIYKLDGSDKIEVPLNKIATSDELTNIVDEVAKSAQNQDNKSVLNLLVRPQGVHAYDNARVRILSRGNSLKLEIPWAARPLGANGKLAFRDQTSDKTSN